MTQINFFTKQKQRYRYQKLNLQTMKKNFPQRGNGLRGLDKSRAWDEHTHTTIYKTDNQQGPPV